MSTITREFTKEQLQQIIETDHVQCGEASALARIALASLEAEAVHQVYDESGGWFDVDSDDVAGEIEDGNIARVLFTAPTAPVSVPECFKRLLHHAYGMTMGHDWNKGTMAGHHREKLCRAVDECRAAMLQGAEPVTTAYKLRDAVETIRNSCIAIDAEKILAERDVLNTPDCWCRTCRPVKLNDMRFVVCPDCGNKRCPHANDHRNACTGSNEPGQEGSAYPASTQQNNEENAKSPSGIQTAPAQDSLPKNAEARCGNSPVIPDQVLSAVRKVARIRADFDDFDGDRRGIGDWLDEAEQELIVTINKYASVIAAAPQQDVKP